MTKSILFSLSIRTILAALWVVLCCGLVFAQRAGSAAQGGSVRPEGVQRATVDPLASPSPRSSLVVGTDDDCNPDTVDGTCPGTFSFSYGFNFNKGPRGGGSSTTRTGFAFAAYVHKRIFVELDSDNVVSAKPETGDRVTGYGDTTAYLGADLLLGSKKYEPSLTLLYGVKVPTASASKGIGTGKVDHTVIAALGKLVGKRKTTYIEFDIGNNWAGRSDGNGFDSFTFASGIMRQKLDPKKKFTVHVEFGGTFKTNDYEGDAYNLTFLESQVTESFALRTGAKFGITDNVSRAGLYIGLKFNGSLKRLF